MYDPGCCAECREPFGEEEGIYDSPEGCVCEECYAYLTADDATVDARWLWDMYNAGVNGGGF